jgi:RNA polymerase sigma-70 factor (ECF subfamily)
MDRYAKGDDSAFEGVYEEVAPRLFGYLRRRMRDVTAAEDLVQQTLLQIHRARASFIPGAAVTPWAFAILRRLTIDKMRHDKRQVPVTGDDEAAASAPETRTGASDELVEARRLAGRVAKILERLPETQRAAFELVRYDGLSLAEAAEALGTTVSAIKSRMHRVHEELRAELGDAVASRASASGET